MGKRGVVSTIGIGTGIIIIIISRMVVGITEVMCGAEGCIRLYYSKDMMHSEGVCFGGGDHHDDGRTDLLMTSGSIFSWSATFSCWRESVTGGVRLSGRPSRRNDMGFVWVIVGVLCEQGVEEEYEWVSRQGSCMEGKQDGRMTYSLLLQQVVAVSRLTCF